MSATILTLILGILLVIIYDFTNGFQDAADMIATSIASGSMTPKIAILLVTIFTFLGPLIGGVMVADTIGEFIKIGDAPQAVAQKMTLAALMAAITFNLISWWLALPNSSTASLTSGLIGSGLCALGNQSINWGITEIMQGEFFGFMKIFTGMFLSPLAGFFVGYIFFKILKKICSHLSIKARFALVTSQYVSVSWLAFSHGTNDAQKGMGVLAMLLFASGVYPSYQVPFWVILLCATSMTMGTLFGGWRIIKTLGFGIYKVKLIHSVADQISSAGVILMSTMVGAPVSTTQVVTAALMGVGAEERPGHVRWRTASSIILGWLVNIPFCLLFGAGYCAILLTIFP